MEDEVLKGEGQKEKKKTRGICNLWFTKEKQVSGKNYVDSTILYR